MRKSSITQIVLLILLILFVFIFPLDIYFENQYKTYNDALSVSKTFSHTESNKNKTYSMGDIFSTLDVDSELKPIKVNLSGISQGIFNIDLEYDGSLEKLISELNYLKLKDYFGSCKQIEITKNVNNTYKAKVNINFKKLQ